MKNFNTLNPTDIFSFPVNWKKFKFYNLFSINKDISKNIEKEAVLSLTQNGIIVKDVKSNKGQIADNYEKYTKVIPNDIVFNPMDLISGWVDIVTKSGVISPSYLSFRLNENKTNPLFVLFLFQSLYVNRMLFNFGKGVATHDGFGRWTINEDTILNTNIYLPDIETQNIAVRYLEQKTKNIDVLLEKLQNKINLLKEQRTSLINHYVTKGLDSNVEMKDSGVEWIGKIPKHWNCKKLKYISQITYGISPNQSTYNDEGKGTVLINGPAEYSLADFGYTRSIKWTTDPKKMAPKGSLLFCVRGSTGRMNICHQDVSIGRGVCAIVSNLDQDFTVYSMMMIRIYIQDQISGSTFPSVVKEDVDNFVLPCPPIEEQRSISKIITEKVNVIEQLIDLHSQKKNHLKEYRRSLIASVVTGKVKITKDMA